MSGKSLPYEPSTTTGTVQTLSYPGRQELFVPLLDKKDPKALSELFILTVVKI